MTTKNNPTKIHEVIVEDVEFGRVGDAPLLARLYRPAGESAPG